jgi:hypothetical protein
MQGDSAGEGDGPARNRPRHHLATRAFSSMRPWAANGIRSPQKSAASKYLRRQCPCKQHAIERTGSERGESSSAGLGQAQNGLGRQRSNSSVERKCCTRSRGATLRSSDRSGPIVRAIKALAPATRCRWGARTGDRPALSLCDRPMTGRRCVMAIVRGGLDLCSAHGRVFVIAIVGMLAF